MSWGLRKMEERRFPNWHNEIGECPVCPRIPTILNDMPDFAGQGMKDYEVTSAMMRYNRQWFLNQLRSGRSILDIGRDPERVDPSIFYEMESNMMKNYMKLHPEWNNVVRK
jgi:hypothetical protein